MSLEGSLIVFMAKLMYNMEYVTEPIKELPFMG
jgi:hypothetical protein